MITFIKILFALSVPAALIGAAGTFSVFVADELGYYSIDPPTVELPQSQATEPVRNPRPPDQGAPAAEEKKVRVETFQGEPIPDAMLIHKKASRPVGTSSRTEWRTIPNDWTEGTIRSDSRRFEMAFELKDEIGREGYIIIKVP